MPKRVSRYLTQLNAANQQIKSIDKQLNSRAKQYTSLSERYYELETALNELYAVLGPHNVFQEAGNFEQFAEAKSFDLHEFPKFDLSTFDSSSLSETVEVKLHRLMMFLYKGYFDKLQQTFHARLEWDGITWGYSIERDSLATIPLRRLVSEISEMLARRVAEDLKRLPCKMKS